MSGKVNVGFAYGMYSTVLYLALKLYNRLHVEGRKNVPDRGGCIIACNHASYLDPPVMGTALLGRRQVRFLARDTLNKGWFMRRFMRQTGVILIAREKGDIGALRKTIQAVREGHVVGLFPEGTRSEDGQLQSPKAGIGFILRKAEVPVVPAGISGSYRAMPKGAKGIKPAKIRMAFGPPVYPQDFTDQLGEYADYEDYARMTMEKIGHLISQVNN